MIFPTSPKGKDCFNRQEKFISQVVSDTGPTSSETVWVKAFSNPPDPTELEFENLSKITDQEVSDAMDRMQAHARRREEEALKKWNEQQSRAKL